MTNKILCTYEPSDALRELVLNTLRDRLPSGPVTDAVLASVNQKISHSVRGLISTIGLGLDAGFDETAPMTHAGALTAEIVKCYAFRLPVSQAEVPRLMRAITDDLYKYAGHPAMVMASARLEVREGELVVVGLETRRERAPGTWQRATLVRLG